MNGVNIETPSTHFKDFYVLVADIPFTTSTLAVSRANEYLKDGNPTRKFSLNNLGIEGRYIRIQAIGTTKMELAEVEVVGREIDPSAALGEDDEIFDAFRLYPNPTNGTIFLDFGKIKKIF